MAERDTDTAKALIAEEQARVVSERDAQAATADAAAAEERRESIAAAAEAIEGEQARRVGEMAERDAAFAAEEAEDRTASTATAIELAEAVRAEAIAASAKADADAAAERCVCATHTRHHSSLRAPFEIRAHPRSPRARCSAGCSATRSASATIVLVRLVRRRRFVALDLSPHTRPPPPPPRGILLISPPHSVLLRTHARTHARTCADSVVNAAEADKAVAIERVRRTSLTGPAPTPPKALLSEIAAKAAAK